ncbi:MAG: hypothetical protein BLM47_08100 [Candidatus Reconcilbacillus cellulovorans]|uniref:Stage VI sporulation protein F n=1 Tax=Candidatus Reconcilbacillus cellulovorans TaxID=1906605 RepID=A0A2A6DZX1_9BACL|nr:MAG: hypothetical protein BLM47_08100 [Candidatus Reconcilbacillus cellulovorans]
MNSKDISKEVLDRVNAKLNKPITAKDVQKLAGEVTPSTIRDERELRRLIRQIADTVNVQVSEKTVNEIVKAVRASGGALENLSQMIRMLLGKS